MGLFAAILDAIGREDNNIAGIAVTRLTSPLNLADTTAFVETTQGFGEDLDGSSDALFLVQGELIYASGRTSVKFTGLSREQKGTESFEPYAEGSLVYDASNNASAIGQLRRGFSVNTAVGEDLDVIGANLGLRRCPGLTDSVWREVIKAVAYLPKQALDAYYRALTALLGAGAFTVSEDLISHPYQVFVEITAALATTLKGRMVLNSGEIATTSGLNTVSAAYPINQVLGVYLDTPLARRGYRSGTDFYGAGSFVGSTITLATSPGPIGTSVILDYGAFEAHYLATDETTRDDADFFAYLSDPTLAASCLLSRIRAAGVQVPITVTT